MIGTKSYYSNAIKRPVLNIQDYDKFRLDSQFLNEFDGEEPEWGPVGKFTFKRTYARPISEDNSSTEEFWQTLERIVNGVYTVQKWHCRHHNLPWSDSKAQRSAQTMFRLMWDFKFLPGGRGLWMMGTDYVKKHGSASLNNCFAPETKAWIDGRLVTLADAYNGTCGSENLSILAGDGEWRNGRVEKFGVQPLRRIEFVPSGVRSNFRLSYEATPNHRWILADGSETTELKVGDQVTIDPTTVSGEDAAMGFAHGLVFGDGTRHTYYPQRHFIRLCSEKDQAHLEHLEANPYYISTNRHPSSNREPIVTFVLPDGEASWKLVPGDDRSLAYQAGFLKGWIAADGSNRPSGTVRLDSQNADAINWAIERAPLLGFCVTGHHYNSTMETNFGRRSAPLVSLTLTSEPTNYRVKAIIDEGRKEEVFCVVEPHTSRFTLEGGLITGNCSFTTTQDIDIDFAEPFCFLMDFSMLGVGVGSDCRGAGKVTIQQPVQGDDVHVVEDSREGWVDLLHRVLQSYVGKATAPVQIDYSKVRPYGELIKGFGGTASGPDPLQHLISEVHRVLKPLIDKPITSEAIVDLFDLIGVCVVAGNVRRSAIIMFGDHNDDSFLNLKNPDLNSAAMKTHRWASNNSIFATVGMDYEKTAAISAKAGEPGYMWLENSRKFGRTGELVNDSRVMGYNPCAEVSLEPAELCNLVELFPSRHASYEEFERTIKCAYLYAKTVSLIPTHNPKTNAVMLRNRRIGLSQSGIIQSFKRHGRRKHFDWCNQGYAYVTKMDRIYSEWLCVRKSIKKTTVKPAGCRPLSAYVTTDQGIFTLAEIMANHPIDQDWDEVDGLTASGIGKPLTKSLRRGQSEVYEICLRNGRKLTSTPNHPWGVEQTEGQTVFTRTDQIVVGSRIMCRPGTYSSTSEAELTVVSGHGFHPNANTDITQPEQMTEDLGWIIGALYGNGSFSTSKHRVRFVHGDLPIIEHYKVLMMKTFGLDIPIHEDSRGSRYYCDVGNKLLFQWFEDNGLRKTKSKRLVGVPVAIRRSSQNSILAFIAGYADTDGCFSRGSFCVDSASEAMMRSLQVVAEAVGISMSVMHNTKGENFQAKKSIWKAHASRVHTLEFARERINALSMKARRSPIDDPKRLNGNRHPHEVVSVRRLSKPVYTGDVEVADDHVFYEGGMLSHNTTSLLPGVTPGIHFEHAEYYFRTVRVASHNPLVEEYRKAGYRVKKDVYDQSKRTSVIYFPVKAQMFDRAKADVSIWEQMENAAQMQKNWSDNSVSITVTFKPEEADDIERVLELYESRLKTVSFLPLNDHGYEQAPYITITKEEYERASAEITDASFVGVGHDTDATPRYCDGDSCIIPVIDRQLKEQALQ